MKYLFLFLLPLYSLAQSLKPGLYRDLKPDKPIELPTGTLTITPYCDENGRYVQVTGGTPPYFIRKSTQTNYTEMNPINDQYLFPYAGPDNPLDPGLAGDYLVKDSGPGTCGNLTPFKIWGNYGTQSNVVMNGVNFVQYNLTFNQATINDHARVYMYGTHEYNSGTTPGGTVGGASLIKTGNGDFTIGTNALITSACGKMWPGIKINNSDAYQRVIGDGATIENAETAMEFLNQNGATKLTLEACTLANNFNGIRVHQGNLSNWTIANSLIYTEEDGLPPPYDDAHNSNLGSGKTFEGNYGIQFVKGGGSTTSSLSLTGTTIRNYMIGIDGYGAWFSADNCTFDKIRLAGINSYVTGVAGININHCTFKLNAANALTEQRTAIRNDPNFVANSNLEPTGTFGIVSNGPQFSITGNTIFEGKAGTFDISNPRVGVYVTNGIDIEKSTIKSLDFGVFVDDPNSTVKIKSNSFEELTQSVVLAGETTVPNGFPFTLSCNQFKTSTGFSGTRTGLVIGTGASLEGNRIGGNGAFGNPPPNANRWPLNSLTWNSTTTPTTVDGFVSIWNQTEEDIEYWRYHNEFIGATSNTNGSLIVPQTLSVGNQDAYVYSAKDLCQRSSDFCGETDLHDCIQAIQANNPCPGYTFPIEINWVRACQGSVVDVLDWPIYVAKPTIPFGDLLTNQQTIEIQPDLQLGIGKPNPANQNIQIPYFLPEKSGKAELWITEVSTGKLIETIQMDKAGHGKVEIALRGYNNGVFAYKLIPENGKSSQTLKFVVIR